MSLELLSAIGSLATVIIVAATAIDALVQLRHLSAANQINAMLETGNEINDKEFHDASFMIRQHLDGAMNDPAFRDYLVAYNHNRPFAGVPAEYLDLHRAVLLVGNKFEEFGVLVKSDIIRRDLFLDVFGWLVMKHWRQLSELNAFVRETTGVPGIWENFEYLAVLAEDWSSVHVSLYPKGIRRMSDANRWPIVGAAASDDPPTSDPALKHK